MTRGNDVRVELTLILIIHFSGKTGDFERVCDDLESPWALGWAAGTRHWVDEARSREVKLKG